jgi:hypothetical protein
MICAAENQERTLSIVTLIAPTGEARCRFVDGLQRRSSYRRLTLSTASNRAPATPRLEPSVCGCKCYNGNCPRQM